MLQKKSGVFNTVCPRDCFGVCALQVTVEDGKVIKVTGHDDNNNSEGKCCSKGASYFKRLYHPERLTVPMLRKDNEFHEITWDQALDLLVNKINTYKSEQGPESIMYLSGWGHTGIMNDYANNFWSQIGPITTSYGSLCMAAGKAGVKYTYGNTVKHHNNQDLQNAQLIIVWGANPANTNIHRMRNIKKAVKRGAKLIVIDPRVSESMIPGAVRIHPKGGTDGLLAMGLAKLLIENNHCDEAFVNKHVLGFDVYKQALSQLSLQEVSMVTEVSLDQIHLLADAISRHPIYALVSGTGKSRYTNGGQTERAISILPALTGSIGVSGGGYYFSDGQQPRINLDYRGLRPYQMNSKIHVGKIAEELTTQTPDIKMMWIEKANPLTSCPNVNQLAVAMDAIEFVVVVEHFMTDTSKVADLILPAAMFAEKNDLVAVYGDAYIHLLQKITDPYGACKSEPEIYRMLGEKMNLDLELLPLVDAAMIDDLLIHNGVHTSYKKLSATPFLTENYNSIAFEDFKFDTPSGKIEIYSEQMKNAGLSPLPSYVPTSEHAHVTPELFKKYPLSFLSAHAAERINSQFTEMKLSPKHQTPSLEIHPLDAEDRKILNGDRIRIFNDRGELTLRCTVTTAIKEGTVHVYEGWGERFNASINKLTQGRLTDFASGTAFHDCLVEVEKLINQ